VFEGIEPTVVITDDAAPERDAAAAFIRQSLQDGIPPDQIAIFVRSSANSRARWPRLQRSLSHGAYRKAQR